MVREEVKATLEDERRKKTGKVVFLRAMWVPLHLQYLILGVSSQLNYEAGFLEKWLHFSDAKSVI